MPHTHTTHDENPKDKEPGMEIDEAGDILYTQKGKYYIRGITDNSPTLGVTNPNRDPCQLYKHLWRYL